MRKILSLVFALAVMLALGVPALAAQATGETVPQVALIASAEKVEAGKTVTLTLSLTGELKDISSFEYYIHYDPTVVTLTGSEVGASSTLIKVGTPPAANYAKTENDNAVTVNAVKFEGDGKFTMSEGTIATFTFTAKEDAAVGTSAGFTQEKVGVYDSTFTDGAISVTTADAPVVTIAAAIVLGDVNDDGEIDNLDANLVYRYFNGSVELTADQLAAADVNGDGEVDNLDANMIYRYFNGIISKF